jgi:hypothetical protein
MEMCKMRNLQRRSVTLSFMAAIFGCAQKSTTGFKSNWEPKGFARIQWGTPFSEVETHKVETGSIGHPAGFEDGPPVCGRPSRNEPRFQWRLQSFTA